MAATSPPTTASNGELVRWAFETLNTRDVAPLRPLWTDDTVEHFPDRTCRGAGEIAEYFEQVLAALPDFHMEVIEIAEQGEHVFVRWHLTGTHTGSAIQGIEPTGRRIELDGIDHSVMRDGVVVSGHIVFDQMSWARQIGLMPTDGSAADRAMKAAFNAKTMLEKKIREVRER
jgi:predicted ester cyclase